MSPESTSEQERARSATNVIQRQASDGIRTSRESHNKLCQNVSARAHNRETASAGQGTRGGKHAADTRHTSSTEHQTHLSESLERVSNRYQLRSITPFILFDTHHIISHARHFESYPLSVEHLRQHAN